MADDTIAIIGGGFSGAMLAVRLARAGVGSTLINRTPEFGLGVAYSTRCDDHLLNVRSGRMSARADDPDHFVRWLDAHHPALADPEAFAPRRVYGLYVRDTLAQAIEDHPGLIDTVVGEAVEVDDTGVRLEDGRKIPAHAVVLATGNPPPDARRREGVIGDPWAPGALSVVGPEDDVVVVGAGLTMIDILLMLKAQGWRGRALALSRRGLSPRPHDDQQIRVPPRRPAEGPLSHRLRAARREADQDGWGVMMDRLRDINAELWADLTPDERSRFLRHLRPWWDVHRHRTATAPARAIEGLRQDGRLETAAGRVTAIEPADGRVRVRWRPRGQRQDQVLTTDHVIDCSGPGYDPRRAADPLTRSLIDSGQAGAAPFGLGLAVDVQGRLVDAQGRSSDRILVLGPPARAAFWETIAVPDIRIRIEDLAARRT